MVFQELSRQGTKDGRFLLRLGESYCFCLFTFFGRLRAVVGRLLEKLSDSFRDVDVRSITRTRNVVKLLKTLVNDAVWLARTTENDLPGYTGREANL